MSSPDIFMSSPPRPRTFDPTLTCSSSPYLPSLDEVFLKKSPKKPPLRTGSHAAPIPTNARATFTSAANVLREAPEIDINTEKITNSPSRRAKPTKGRKRKSSTPDNLSNDQASNQEPVVIESLSPKEKPWQKFKNKASTRHNKQSSLSSMDKAPTSRKIPGKTTETVSRHFTTGGGDPFLENGSEGEKSKADTKQSLEGALTNTELEPAVPRRGDWTPPRINAPIVLDSDSDARELFSSVGKGPVSKDVFQTLYDQYGRQDIDLALESCPQPQAEFLKKRRRIELVSIAQEEQSKQLGEECLVKDPPLPQVQKKRAEPKAPAPKKKTRTITEAAIAPFAVPVAPEIELTGPSTSESMLNYFDSDGAVKALVEHQTAVMSQRKPKGKETKQPPKTKRKKKAGTEANPILLSPNSALKQSSNQDFVFGTSSQLVQEDSPTTLRDFQAAIRTSNSLNSDPFDDDMCQRLWQAGARDEDGELMGMEVVDLRHGPVFATEPNRTPMSDGRGFVDIDDVLDSPRPVTSTSNVPSESQPASSHFFQSQSTEHTFSTESCTLEGPNNIRNVEPRPNYELFTDAQLSKQITSYGFKPVKKRAAMIALLDQCWASKHQGTSESSMLPLPASTRSSVPSHQESAGDVTNKATVKPRGRDGRKKDGNVMTSFAQPTLSDKPSPKRSRGRPKKNDTAPAPIVPTAEPSTSTSSPKRPRGRPRKPSSASIEIADSENSTPSPVSSPDPVFSSPPPLDLTTSDEGDMSLTLSPTNQQAELFKHITRAVTSAARSRDPLNPSWYEKMLLYDPIILEDLASWLNGGELTGVGYDGEVSPHDVKKWCESKSVICLWRQNINGKERKRY
ncbi:hypothetical protein HD806DRAFT_508811 [Xylariaceae sp. AK1471]|nr:hypothetical protein HD806DRAFT_508811 [Xylariaceae sp. AK1471]